MKTTVITCADSYVYVGVCQGLCKKYIVAIRMNMATLKTTTHWWYKYSNDGKAFTPDSEDSECDTLARMQDKLIDTYEREFTLSSVKRLYEN